MSSAAAGSSELASCSDHVHLWVYLLKTSGRPCRRDESRPACVSLLECPANSVFVLLTGLLGVFRENLSLLNLLFVCVFVNVGEFGIVFVPFY